MFSNNNDKEPSFSSDYLSTGEHKWRWDIMRILFRLFLEIVLLVLFLSSLLAGFNAFFLEFVTLSSHSCFRDSHTRSLDENAIDWNVHSCLDLDHITNNDVVILDWLLFSLSETNDLQNIRLVKLTMLSLSLIPWSLMN